MSGIYIPGIELPKDGWKTLRIYPTGEVGIPNWQGDCRFHDFAIPVPDHGRLGDLDKLESGLRLMAEYQEGYRQQGILGCCETIRAAKTIIPADRKAGAE